MWLALISITGTNMFVNINRVGGIWEQSDRSAKLLIDGEEVYVRDNYSTIVAAIKTAQPFLNPYSANHES